MSALLVEPTTLLRDWLRTTIGDAITEATVWAGGLPNPYSVTDDGPAVVLWRVGGGFLDSSGAAVDVGLYQLDCCTENPRDAAHLAGELQTTLFDAPVPILLPGSNMRLCGWSQIAGRADFDPDPKFSRYIVTAQATTIARIPDE